MAIVEMKRISLLALKQDRGKLLRAMQQMDCVQITQAASDEMSEYLEMDRSRLDRADELLSRVGWAIGQLSRYRPAKAPMFGKKPLVALDQADKVAAGQDALMKIVEQVEDCERRSGELKGQAARVQVAMEQLEPWRGLDIPAADLKRGGETVQWIGTLPKGTVESVENAFGSELVYITVLSAIRETVSIWAVAHRSCQEAFGNALKEAGFVPVQLGDIVGTPAEQQKAYQAELMKIQKAQEDISQELTGLSSRVDDLKILYDVIFLEQERLDAASRFVGTGKAFLMRGWVPAPAAEQVEKRLCEISPTCSVDISVPEPGDEPPTFLHNNRAAAPFESIVEGFALPSPHGFDPTAIMAPFFACLFGMMVSDAGYGLFMAIGIPIFIKVVKPSKKSQRLMWVLAMGGVFTLFWGFMYNTWFGFSPIPSVFDPINNALPVMMLCIAMGAIHLLAGLGIAAYMNIRRGKPLDAVYDQLSWVMVLGGAGMLLLPQTAQAGQWIALAGVAIIVLTAGRGKSKNPFKRLISGLGALYGATSWISDLLSYMRLFGMGLATGVIGMVINQLVGMVFSSGIIGMVIGSVLFVGAHAFNAGINILGAYVHSCRLQYIEFFGKFYEEGGKPFTPLNRNTRYVNIEEAR